MTEAEAVAAARILVTEKSEASVDVTLPRLKGMIPTALYEFRKWIRNSPQDLPLIQETISLTFAAGTSDLTNYVNGTTKNLNLSDIKNSTLYDASGNPMTWLASQAQINNPRQLDASFVGVFMDGKTLRTINVDGSKTTFAATVTFQGVNYPIATTAIPAQCEEQFVEILAALVMGGAG